jgi:hypothetical protein
MYVTQGHCGKDTGEKWCMQASLLEEAKAHAYVFEYALNKAV